MRSLVLGVGLIAVVLSGAFAQNAGLRATPRGMSSLPTNGSGVVLATQLSGSPSATKMYKALLIGIKGYFDVSPKALNAFRDARDTQIQVAFSASMNRTPVTGLIGVAVQGSQARAVILFDASRAFAGSVNRLVTVATTGGGAGAAANIPLTRVQFPDGSGSIGLAQGWQLKYAQQGAADIAGPDWGSGMSIGANLIVPYTSSDPAQALKIMSQQQAQSQGQNVRLTILDSKPTEWQNGNASFVRYRTVTNGVSVEYFGLFAITPYDGNQVFLYTTYIQATTANFAKVLPAGLKMWGSWSVNPAVFAERLNAAARSMRETGELIAGANANRQRAYEGINAGWSEYIRDVATIEDQGGNRAQLDASFADKVMQSNPGDFRVVPPSELIVR